MRNWNRQFWLFSENSQEKESKRKKSESKIEEERVKESKRGYERTVRERVSEKGGGGRERESK